MFQVLDAHVLCRKRKSLKPGEGIMHKQKTTFISNTGLFNPPLFPDLLLNGKMFQLMVTFFEGNKRDFISVTTHAVIGQFSN